MGDNLLAITGTTYFDGESLRENSVVLLQCRQYATDALQLASPGSSISCKPLQVASNITSQPEALVQAWIADLCPEQQKMPLRHINFDGDILSSGFVDLQVNGGGGHMFNNRPDVETLTLMADAQLAAGTAEFLPTLITDSPQITAAAVDAVEDAVRKGVPGIAGLHLEGPHLSIARCGAHTPALIRPMSGDDMNFLIEAATRLPLLFITIAPESVTIDQVRRLADNGIVLSLGHTDADYATCCEYFDAGVGLVTHLYNAMSPLRSREPGLVGAMFSRSNISAGLIADGIHVHTGAIRSAWNTRVGKGRLFLVTDAMATHGSLITQFTLNGRRIVRSDSALRLADGTLAGADLDMVSAVRMINTGAGVSLADALAAATTAPKAILDSFRGPAESSAENDGTFQQYIRINQSITQAHPIEHWAVPT